MVRPIIPIVSHHIDIPKILYLPSIPSFIIGRKQDLTFKTHIDVPNRKFYL